MRFLLSILAVALLHSCKDQSNSKDSPPAREPDVSYSRQVRPWLIANCLECHQSLPLHAPQDWDLAHTHQADPAIPLPDFVRRWIDQGRPLDPHWATSSLTSPGDASLDELLPTDLAPLSSPRQAPRPLFTAPVEEIIAGDFMAKPAQALATGYFRKGDDTPNGRTLKAATHFLGLDLSCAQCHDHPSEPWTTERYQALRSLFTTPFDHLPNALPPVYVRQRPDDLDDAQRLREKILQLREPSEIDEKQFQAWLAREGSQPQLPGLLAAYSFDDPQLTNLAPHDEVIEGGVDLRADQGAHGLALAFDGQNELTLSDLPVGSDTSAFTISTWVKLAAEAADPCLLVQIGTEQNGFDLAIVGRKVRARFFTVWPEHAISVTSKTALIAPERWAHLALSYDGSRSSDGFSLFLNGRRIEAVASPTSLVHSPVTAGQPWRFSGKGLHLDELQVYRGVLADLAIAHLFDGFSLISTPLEALREFYQRHASPTEAERQASLRETARRLADVESRAEIFLVMASVSPANDSDLVPENRLAWAETLDRERLARALANQVWQQHFGVPLVSGLGYRDPLPKHPELLDGLALKLLENNFDLKELGEVIRASRAWSHEWPHAPSPAVDCPRTK